MLIKLIQCTVNEDSKKAFHIAQSGWSSQLAAAPGFKAQVGGWNQLNVNDAIIVAFWESHGAYQHFMTELHDQIMNENQQSGSYEKIEISLGNAEKRECDIDSMDLKILTGLTLLDDSTGHTLDDQLREKSLLMMQMNNNAVPKRLLLQNVQDKLGYNVEARIDLEPDWHVFS
ncbi:DUF4937 domain-containing protein [Paenibacillus puldeungensis]|uniref:DUF4937 domain-containing protein n=1 Tax=Paenibacillus puldeungensis TaxID=696536 RepID=A0ABW3S1K9_9BACL